MAWSADEKEQAIALVMMGDRISEVSRKTGIPKQTVSSWVREATEEMDKEGDDFASARRLNIHNMVARAYSTASRSIDLLERRVSAAQLPAEAFDKIVLEFASSGMFDLKQMEMLKAFLESYKEMDTADLIRIFNTASEKATALDKHLQGDGDDGQIKIDWGTGGDAFGA